MAIYLVSQGIVSYDVSMNDSGHLGAAADVTAEEAADGGAAAASSSALDRLRRELARGTAELRILSLVSSRRRYGYELMKLLGQAGEGVMEIKEGTLYPLLHRLEDAGHIVATWDAAGRSRPRKYYAITPDGRAHLALLRAEWSGLVDGMHELLKTLEEVEE